MISTLQRTTYQKQSYKLDTVRMSKRDSERKIFTGILCLNIRSALETIDKLDTVRMSKRDSERKISSRSFDRFENEF